MSLGRKRRGLAEAAEEHPDERWMASYMDMVTVLMCMFIVLFSMSSVDQEKFEQLRNSLASGFGVIEVGAIDTAEGVVVPPEQVEEEAEGFSDLERAIMEVDALTTLQEKIGVALQERQLAHSVEFEINERGLSIKLVGSETYFESNNAELIGVAPQILDTIAPSLAATSYEISVEGHADHRAAAFPFATNWELSAGRATAVLRRLVEHGGVAAHRIAATAFGDARPVMPGSSAPELAQNRRVDIVVQSDESEAVRALIAKLMEERRTVG